MLEDKCLSEKDFQSGYYSFRCFWFLMVFTMAASLGAVITMQLKNYYEWPTVINIQETPMSAFDIPEVTICSQEPMAFTFYSDVWRNAVQDFRDMDIAVHTETLVLSSDPGCNATDQSGQCLLDKANSTERTRLLTASLDRSGWDFPKAEFYKKIVTDMGVCNTFKTSEFLKVLAARNASLSSAEVPLDIVLAVKPSFTWVFPGNRVGLQVTRHLTISICIINGILSTPVMYRFFYKPLFHFLYSFQYNINSYHSRSRCTTMSYVCTFTVVSSVPVMYHQLANNRLVSRQDTGW